MTITRGIKPSEHMTKAKTERTKEKKYPKTKRQVHTDTDIPVQFTYPKDQKMTKYTASTEIDKSTTRTLVTDKDNDQNK